MSKAPIFSKVKGYELKMCLLGYFLGVFIASCILRWTLGDTPGDLAWIIGIYALVKLFMRYLNIE